MPCISCPYLRTNASGSCQVQTEPIQAERSQYSGHHTSVLMIASGSWYTRLETCNLVRGEGLRPRRAKAHGFRSKVSIRAHVASAAEDRAHLSWALEHQGIMANHSFDASHQRAQITTLHPFFIISSSTLAPAISDLTDDLRRPAGNEGPWRNHHIGRNNGSG